MGTFKETQGDPDRIDYGKIAKSLVEQFIHTVTQWGPVPVSFHMVSFVVCQSFHLSRIAKSQRLEHRAISFFHDWSCSFFERLRYFNVLIRMHWAGITSESLVLQPRRLKPSDQSFAKKRFWKKAVLISKLTGSSRFSSTDRSMVYIVNPRTCMCTCSHRLFGKFVLPSDHLCSSPRGIRGQVQLTTFAGVRLVWPS